MDNYVTGGIGASITIVLAVLYKIYTTVNHHKIRSNCCGRKTELSIDIDDTTPKDQIQTSSKAMKISAPSSDISKT